MTAQTPGGEAGPAVAAVAPAAKRERNDIPPEKLFVVTNDIKKIDFGRPYKYVYFDWWFNLLTFPVILALLPVAALAALYLGLRVSGRENKRILRKRGCVVISNHCHYFDTVFAAKAVFPRRLYISVAQRDFEVPVVRRILRVVRAFPIPARAMGFKMITGPVGEALRRGHHVLFLPEGDLVYLSQEIYRFKPGAFYMSCLHQAPVLPMVYVFTKRFRRDGSENVHRPHMRQVFGEPLYPPAMCADGSYPKEELKDMMERAACWMEDTITAYGAGEPATV
jgi:1-acyl-sn-glycerol-3-phosphate acyltransferase